MIATEMSWMIWKTLVSLLELANAKILVVIEDADRASSLDFDLGHLERVLSRLRNTRRVSCALALDPTKARIDLLRLCEHVEPLPPLESQSCADRSAGYPRTLSPGLPVCSP